VRFFSFAEKYGIPFIISFFEGIVKYTPFAAAVCGQAKPSG
jgi:hypothetical protein